MTGLYNRQNRNNSLWFSGTLRILQLDVKNTVIGVLWKRSSSAGKYWYKIQFDVFYHKEYKVIFIWLCFPFSTLFSFLKYVNIVNLVLTSKSLFSSFLKYQPIVNQNFNLWPIVLSNAAYGSFKPTVIIILCYKELDVPKASKTLKCSNFPQ